jgi:hypothetical protein
MALGDPYASLTQLKSYLKITDTTEDDELDDALKSASRGIEDFCGRQFNDAVTASARVYYPEHPCLVEVDDFHTITGLVVKTDEGDDGTYETTWDAADYQLKPLNGIVSGQTGWPWSEVWAVESRRFPRCVRRASVEVTARWGWAAVPAPVKQACLIVAAETFKLKDAPFGVAGFGDFGAVRVRESPMAKAKLAPYVRDAALVG